jgi:hypothetical protein
MYKFIIDTDQYSGNFEREMCAYLTGQIGECGVGCEYAELFEKEVSDKISFNNVISILDDEDSCRRPCKIEINPNWFNTGMGAFYKNKDFDEEKIRKEYADQVFNYEDILINQKKIIKEKLLKGEKYSNWTIEACDKEIANHEEIILKARNAKTCNKYPAYLSVAIFFKDKPTEEQISLMKERALNFDKKYCLLSSWKSRDDFKITIENFRLVKISKTETEEFI